MKANWLNRIFGQKFFLAPPGYDPTVDELPAGWTNRKSGGGGAGAWLTVLFWGTLLAGVLAFGFRGQIGAALAQSQPTTSAASSPTATAGSLSAPAGLATSAHPTRTPLVWPTLGVLKLTPTPGGPPTLAATVTEGASPTPGLPTLEGATSSPTPEPTQTARVVYQSGGGGGSVATVVVYITEPPLPTFTPLPTYTPFPTYTSVPASPSATSTETSTPAPTATCPAPVESEPAAPGAYVLYLPLVTGGGPAASCAP